MSHEEAIAYAPLESGPQDSQPAGSVPGGGDRRSPCGPRGDPGPPRPATDRLGRLVGHPQTPRHGLPGHIGWSTMSVGDVERPVARTRAAGPR